MNGERRMALHRVLVFVMGNDQRSENGDRPRPFFRILEAFTRCDDEINLVRLLRSDCNRLDSLLAQAVPLQAWKREKRRQWDKDHLMTAAQVCGLSDKDICETKDLSAPGNPANFYNSWSCFRVSWRPGQSCSSLR